MTFPPATHDMWMRSYHASGGTNPAYVSLDRTGRFLFVANYAAGSIAAYALKPDGSLGDRTALIQHMGSSVHPTRQTHPYAHAIIPSPPDNRFVLVSDLGVDHLVLYRFDEKTGALTPRDPPFAAVKPGSGPRPPVFHPNGRLLYVVNEIANSVTGFKWKAAKCTLTEF